MEAARDRSRELAAAARDDQPAAGRPRMSGLLVFSDDLTKYDFGRRPPDGPGPGHQHHLAGPPARRAGPADRSCRHRRSILPAADRAHAGVHRRGAARRAATRGTGWAPATTRSFPACTRSSGLVAMASVEAARRVWTGEVQRASNISGGLHHAMPGPHQRLLRLQRHRRRHPLAAGQRLRAGRLRRRRCPPRRRRAGDLLRRPAGDDRSACTRRRRTCSRAPASRTRPAGRERRAPR